MCDNDRYQNRSLNTHIHIYIKIGKHEICRREEIYVRTVLGLSFVGGIQQAAYQQLDTRA